MNRVHTVYDSDEEFDDTRIETPRGISRPQTLTSETFPDNFRYQASTTTVPLQNHSGKKLRNGTPRKNLISNENKIESVVNEDVVVDTPIKRVKLNRWSNSPPSNMKIRPLNWEKNTKEKQRNKEEIQQDEEEEEEEEEVQKELQQSYELQQPYELQPYESSQPYRSEPSSYQPYKSDEHSHQSKRSHEPYQRSEPHQPSISEPHHPSISEPHQPSRSESYHPSISEPHQPSGSASSYQPSISASSLHRSHEPSHRSNEPQSPIPSSIPLHDEVFDKTSPMKPERNTATLPHDIALSHDIPKLDIPRLRSPGLPSLQRKEEPTGDVGSGSKSTVSDEDVSRAIILEKVNQTLDSIKRLSPVASPRRSSPLRAVYTVDDSESEEELEKKVRDWENMRERGEEEGVDGKRYEKGVDAKRYEEGVEGDDRIYGEGIEGDKRINGYEIEGERYPSDGDNRIDEEYENDERVIDTKSTKRKYSEINDKDFQYSDKIKDFRSDGIKKFRYSEINNGNKFHLQPTGDLIGGGSSISPQRPIYSSPERFGYLRDSPVGKSTPVDRKKEGSIEWETEREKEAEREEREREEREREEREREEREKIEKEVERGREKDFLTQARSNNWEKRDIVELLNIESNPITQQPNPSRVFSPPLSSSGPDALDSHQGDFLTALETRVDNEPSENVTDKPMNGDSWKPEYWSKLNRVILLPRITRYDAINSEVLLKEFGCSRHELAQRVDFLISFNKRKRKQKGRLRKVR